MLFYETRNLISKPMYWTSIEAPQNCLWPISAGVNDFDTVYQFGADLLNFEIEGERKRLRETGIGRKKGTHPKTLRNYLGQGTLVRNNFTKNIKSPAPFQIFEHKALLLQALKDGVIALPLFEPLHVAVTMAGRFIIRSKEDLYSIALKVRALPRKWSLSRTWINVS